MLRSNFKHCFSAICSVASSPLQKDIVLTCLPTLETNYYASNYLPNSKGKPSVRWDIFLSGENPLCVSALRNSSRAQQQWHRLILKKQRGDLWMSQTSPGSSPSPNIPGTPSALARRGPAKPLHTQNWRERASTRASTRTHRHTLPGMRTAFTSGL